MSLIPDTVPKTLRVADLQANICPRLNNDEAYLAAYLGFFRTWFKGISEAHAPSWVDFVAALSKFETFVEVEHVNSRVTSTLAPNVGATPPSS